MHARSHKERGNLLLSSSVHRYYSYIVNHVFLLMPSALIAFFITVALLVLLARAAKAKKRSPVVRARRILTDNETEFYYRLQRALPHYHVLTQVSFAALLTSSMAHRVSTAVRK